MTRDLEGRLICEQLTRRVALWHDGDIRVVADRFDEQVVASGLADLALRPETLPSRRAGQRRLHA